MVLTSPRSCGIYKASVAWVIHLFGSYELLWVCATTILPASMYLFPDYVLHYEGVVWGRLQVRGVAFSLPCCWHPMWKPCPIPHQRKSARHWSGWYCRKGAKLLGTRTQVSAGHRGWGHFWIPKRLVQAAAGYPCKGTGVAAIEDFC